MGINFGQCSVRVRVSGIEGKEGGVESAIKSYKKPEGAYNTSQSLGDI